MSASWVAFGTDSTFFPNALLRWEMKNEVNNGISSRRSRNGGISMGKTPRR
jgi:hypothetical protein